MKKTIFAVSMGILLSAASAQSQDRSFDWGDCKLEVTKYCKALKDNEQIYSCLEEHDSDLSAKCEAVHAKYEALTGRKKAK